MIQTVRGGYAVWAPDVVYNEHYVNEDGSKGAYMIYYSASSTYCRSAIGYAVSDTVKGYSLEEIVGVYEFLNHGTNSDGAGVRNPEIVILMEDEMSTYINGELVQFARDDFGTIMDSFKVATGNYLGASYYADPDFCGKMDNVGIYNTCLSEDAVYSLSGK